MDKDQKKRIIIILCIGAGLILLVLLVPWIYLKIAQGITNTEKSMLQTNLTVKDSMGDPIDIIDEDVKTGPKVGFHVECSDSEFEKDVNSLAETLGVASKIRYLNREDGSISGMIVNGREYNFRIMKSQYFNPIETDGKYYYRDYAEEGMYADFEIRYSKNRKYVLINFNGNEEVEEAFDNISE